MTEDNFVDYVKVFVRSGNGGAGSSHLRRENLLQKEDLTVEMEEMVAILFLRLTKTCGHYSTLNSKNILKLSMVKMEENLEVQVPMERMSI